MRLLFTVWLLGCATEPAPSPPAPEAPVPAPAAPASPVPPPTPVAPSNEVARLAVVKEILTTDRYAFFRMDGCGQEAWVAAPPTEGIAVGDVLALPNGMVMTDFESVTLKRTFDAILFVEWVKKSDEEPACGPMVKATENQRIGVVLESSEAGGYHYAKLSNCGDVFWVAGQGAPMAPGTTILTEKGNLMTNFKSPTTGQTFEEIVFVARYQVVPGLPLCE